MNRFLSILLIIAVLVNFLGCTEKESDAKDAIKERALFHMLTEESTNISFNNRIEENGKFNMVDYIYAYNGGGVAIGDINNDDLPDIYFTGNMVNDRLYLNKGDLKFEDISDSAGINIPGWSAGVTMVDINHDGLLDIYVSRSGNYNAEKRKNLLFINNGNLTFNEQAETFGIADTNYSTQAAFFDYDKDGDLDMYLLNHTNEIRNPNKMQPPIVNGSGLSNDRLYRNDEVKNSGIVFTDVTKQAGILYDGLGLGLGIADINNDGWEDVFVTNDFLADDYLYINNQDGTFKEMSKSYFDHVSHFSMGNDLADFNNDGLTDLMTLDMLPKDNFHKKKMSGPMNNDLFKYSLQMGYAPQFMRNTLQLNQGAVNDSLLSFSEIGQLAGIDATDWSWGPLLADFDNDGWKDLFISNGFLRDITDLDFINYTQSLVGTISMDSLDGILKQKAKERPPIKLPNFLFQNLGNLTFQNVSQKWGIDQPSLSNGAAYADLDSDGDLDLVVNNINEEALVYENLANTFEGNNFLQVRLVGDSLNTFGLGAKVKLFHEGTQQVVEQNVTRGYQSSVDFKIHFGIGDIDKIDSIVVQWPDSKTNTLYDIKSNQTVEVHKIKGVLSPQKLVKKPNKTLFTEVTDLYKLDHEHQDPEFNDFNRQYLLPHKLSQQGPGIAVGDVNGDGLDDFFIGSGYDHSGYIFHQTTTGKFKKVPLTSIGQEKYEEDTGSLFFDYDNDGDQDLYVVSGSNEFLIDSEYYRDRLYANDGKGNFTLDAQALPNIRNSGSCVRATDFDGDGDLDLFVGGRLTPQIYPLPPNSYLLINQNGKFTDGTPELAPGLQRIGMVTDALWTDYDNDFDVDLIIVGEFMPIQFMENIGGKFRNSSAMTGLDYTSGWWNSINSGDFDNDGDIDYILGNLGLNTKYKVSREEPLTIYASDYDKNGFIDPIMSYYIDHVEYPTHPRDELIRQIPSMKKNFPDYKTYAKASIEDILSPSDKSSSYITKAFRFSSSYLENMGEGKFKLHDLPLEAQLAPVFGLIVEDFNMDGFLDVLLTGNNRGTEVGAGSYDALKGQYLKGNGNGNFKSISPLTSGLFIGGDVRGAAIMEINGQLVYLFGQNSGQLKVYATTDEQYEVLEVPMSSVKAKIKYIDGSERLCEFYFGSSYLSQSKRFIKLDKNIQHVMFYDSKGKEDKVDF